MDRALFRAPFVLIGPDNRSVGTASTFGDAECALVKQDGDASSFVATLDLDYLAVDIDPSDTGSEPESGHVVSENIILWCERIGLAWIGRDSGRPGHRHLIIKVPPDIRNELRSICRKLGAHHGVSTEVRSSLRPLGAPHRLGLDAQAIDGILTLTDLDTRQKTSGNHHSSKKKHKLRLKKPSSTASRIDKKSRSEGEFGLTLARVRSDWSEQACWLAIAQLGSKALEMGRQSWRRWVWAPAITIVDAERGRTANQAWRNFNNASPGQAKFLGFDGWLREKWTAALVQAATNRPRRLNTESTSQLGVLEQLSQVSVQTRTQAVADGLITAAHQRIAGIRRLPKGIKIHTLMTALQALALPIANRRGSISVRAWAEESRLDPKTIRKARDAACELGLIYRAHTYQGGVEDCDAWLPTNLSISHIYRLLNTHNSTTELYTPKSTTGRASLERLQKAHAADRTQWIQAVHRIHEKYRTRLGAAKNSHGRRMIYENVTICRPPRITAHSARQRGKVMKFAGRHHAYLGLTPWQLNRTHLAPGRYSIVIAGNIRASISCRRGNSLSMPIEGRTNTSSGRSP